MTRLLVSEDLPGAVRLLAQRGTELHAGGTDVIDRVRQQAGAPDVLVRIARHLASDVAPVAGGLSAGAGLTLAALGRDARFAPWTALVEGCDHTATPQIREAATLGGALRQRQRCVYYRHPEIPCLQKGGSRCFAREGDASGHAIFETDAACIAVHPSTLACALLAHDASLEVLTPDGSRTLSVRDAFALDARSTLAFDALPPASVITRILLPRPATRSAYVRASARALADWGDVELAGAVMREGGVVKDARIVLGGVARVPRVADNAARAIVQGASRDAIVRAATADAAPLESNGHKLTLLGGAVRVLLDRLLP